MSRLFGGVVAVILLCAAMHHAFAQAPGRVDPVPPIKPAPAPAVTPAPAPPPAAAPAPAPAPAATEPAASPDATTEEPTEKPKAKKSTKRRHAHYRYGYWGRPYYYSGPRYWWPFHRPRYHAWRHHRRHYHGHFFWFRW